VGGVSAKMSGASRRPPQFGSRSGCHNARSEAAKNLDPSAGWQV